MPINRENLEVFQNGNARKRHRVHIAIVVAAILASPIHRVFLPGVIVPVFIEFTGLY